MSLEIPYDKIRANYFEWEVYIKYPNRPQFRWFRSFTKEYRAKEFKRSHESNGALCALVKIQCTREVVGVS